MKITEHLFKLTGVEYETNSNIYAVQYEKGIILIDCGYQEEQWYRMARCMKQWELNLQDITHVFITHSHFDHAGNVWRVNELGAEVFSSSADAEKIEHGNPEMEKLFGAKWKCGIVDHRIKENDRFSFPGDVTVTVLETPGHCEGELSYLLEVDGIRALCTGDQFFVTPFPPEDKVSVELGYMGSSDFNLSCFTTSLKRIKEMDFDVLLPGHYYFYRGEHVHYLLEQAYLQAKRLERGEI